jgi:hypothetical protein
VALASGGHAADLLDRHHECQNASQLLRDQPAGPPDRPDDGELPARPRVRRLLHQKRHRHGGRRRAGGPRLLHGGFRYRARLRPIPGVGQLAVSHGLAIPLQATIIPVYLISIRLHLYDSLLAIIRPSIAFAIPLSVLVLSNFIRDVGTLESMRMDGASEWKTLWNLAFPLTRPALVTVRIYNGLAIWNGLLLPIVLTQSPDKRTLPLALWTFQGQYSINVPAVLASVVPTSK